RCWCGRDGCLETWISGPGFARDYQAATGDLAAPPEIVARARAGDAAAGAALDRYIDRLARGLAVIADVLDPDVIVLGGGVSNIDELYARTHERVAEHVFSDAFATPIRKALHGDSSGVRGAAWLWPVEP
ncbi:MAG TPA: ROK family protein, partial [Caulobacteraceae bacterium]